MRALGLATVLLLASCSPATQPVPPDPSAFEVDAKGAPAVVDQTLTLDGLGEPIGVALNAARCGDLLLIGDNMAQVRRMEVSSGRTLPSIARDVSNVAMAVDCEARSLYLLGDPRKKGPRGRRVVQAFNIDSGAAGRVVAVDLMMAANGNATLLEGALVVGGTWMPMPPNGRYEHPPLASFYSDKRLGFKVSLKSGESEPLLQPYEPSCRVNCPATSLAPVVGQGSLAWVATQASSKEIAFYDAAGTVQRRFDIASPLFADDGSVLRKLGSEADIRWAARNSLVTSADQFGEVVATIHSRALLPEGWRYGQSFESDYWMNLHGVDGRKLVSDIKLPGRPMGRDETHLYLTAYGPDGRHSSPDRLKILRIPVKTGTEGFRH